MGEKFIRVSPYTLNRDLGGCHRCFAEALNGEVLPERFSTGLGKVCSRLGRHHRDFFNERPTSALSADLPAGVIRNGSGVMSRPFKHEGVTLTIRGRIDAIARLDDGRVVIVDFKSGFPNEHTAERFRPQLSAYHWALTNPADDNIRNVAGLQRRGSSGSPAKNKNLPNFAQNESRSQSAEDNSPASGEGEGSSKQVARIGLIS